MRFFVFLGQSSLMLVVRRWLGVVVCVVGLVLGVGSGVAWGASAVLTSFGTQPIGHAGNGSPAGSLWMGVGAGVSVMRQEFEVMTPVSGGGFAQDGVVRFFAQQGVAVLPLLGLPCDTAGCPVTWSPSPGEAAQKMSALITQVAERYGVGGTFWRDNPSVAYHPITEFEIGNEQNLFKEWVVDDTHLHWAPQSHTQPDTQGPAAYAQVYEAARAALHAVDPTGIALVGGLADSAKLNVDVQSAERYIAALTPGTVDAVGYHDWVFDVSTSSMTTDQFTALEEQDPAALRAWMQANGYWGVPISITEIGACDQTSGTTVDSFCAVNHSSAQWGAVMANVVRWATCTPGMGVNNIEAFWWGDTPGTASNGWLALLDSSGTPTAYGQAFLAATKALTTNGCPSPTANKPVEYGESVDQRHMHCGSDNDRVAGGVDRKSNAELPVGALRCHRHELRQRRGYRVELYPHPRRCGLRLQLLVTAINSGGVATASSGLSPIVICASRSGDDTPGCTAVPINPPTAVTRGKTAVPKLSMGIRIVKVVRKGGRVTVTVRFVRRSGTLSATAVEVVKKHHKALRRRLTGRRKNASTMTFTGRLSLGKWVLSITGKPARGYAIPKAVRGTIRIVAASKGR